MSDLIFNINPKECTRLKRPVIETYSGKIKKLKSKTFSGPLTKTDINSNDYDNMPFEQLLYILNKVSNEGYSKITKYKYVFNEEEFIQFIKYVYNNENLYFTAKDGKMYQIDNILNIDKIDYKINNNQIKFFLIDDNKRTIEISTFNICVFFNMSIIYHNNILFIVNSALNEQFFNKIEKQKFKIGNNIKQEILKEMYQTQNNGVGVDQYSENYYSMEPSPVLYIIFDTNKVYGQLYFDYNGIELESNSIVEFVNVFGKRYYRNLEVENECIKILNICFGHKTKENVFIYNGIKALDIAVGCLLNNKFAIYTEDGKKVFTSSNMNFSISYNINWFEINGDLKFNDKTFELAELLDLKDSNGRYIEIDNSALILPEFINEKKKYVNKRNKKLIIPKQRIGEVLELANEMKVDKIVNLNELINYENIEFNLPQELFNKLRDYQIAGIKWLKYLYKNGFGGCLADDMGLGKTIQVIGFLSDKEFNTNESITFIVVPKTLLSNWEKEIKKFNESLSVQIYHGNSRKQIQKNFNFQKGIFLTTYGTVLNDINILSKIPIDCLIIDEVQYIKNSNSKSYGAINKLNTKCRFALSGTPYENNIGEVWAIMNVLNSNILGKKSDFINRYKNIYDDNENIKKLKLRIDPYFLRRTKKEVLDSLPPKIEQDLYCDMTEEQRELYNGIFYKIKEELNRQPGRYVIKDNSVILEGLLLLRQICCHPRLLPINYNINRCKESGKFDLFKMKIEEIVNSKNKVIVFSQFTSMLKIMKNWIQKQGFKYFYLDGATKNRQVVVDEFENSDDGIFLISLKAGGTGLNLVSCQYVIIYDPWWNPAVEDQAADRVYRIGQTKNVIIYKLIVTDSIEEKIQELKDTKEKIGSNLFSDMGDIKEISFEEIKGYFE